MIVNVLTNLYIVQNILPHMPFDMMIYIMIKINYLKVFFSKFFLIIQG
jgi:hypothetical protein